MKKTQLVPTAAMYSRKSYKASAVLLAALAAASTASAAQRTWEGNNSISLADALNYVGGTAPISNSDGILFNAAGSAGTSLFQNTNTQYTNAGGAVIFSATAPSYTIGGTGILNIGTGGFVNNSGVLQTINNNLNRNVTGIATIGANNGTFTFGGTVNVAGGTIQTAFGATTGGVINFNGNLIPTAGTGNLNVQGGAGSGTVNLNGSANTGLNGLVTIGQNVTLNVGSSTGLASATTVLINNTGATLSNTSGTAISTNASLSVNASSAQAVTFGASGQTSANNITLNGTTGITADLNRTITVNGTGTTFSSASVWTNNSASSRTMTVNGAGNTFAIGGINIAVAADAAVNRNFIVAGTGNLSIGALSNGAGTTTGTRALTLTGSGVTTITGASDWNGTTTVGATSSLLINGSHTGGRVYTVNGLLGGTGSITTTLNSAVTVLATGRLQANSADGLTFDTGTGALDIDLALAAVTPSMLFTLGAPGSVLIAATSADIGTGLLEFNDFTFTAGAGFDQGTYTLFDLGSLVGSLGSNLTGTIGLYDATISVVGSDILLTVIPEPSTYAAVAGLGVLGLAAIRRRRKAA